MWGHSDAVYDMVALSDSALCSCGADGLVILWKDGREQTEIRYEDTFPSSTHTRVCRLISPGARVLHAEIRWRRFR